MTSEEREHMNSLSAGIHEETDYNKFAAMLHEMSELIARKDSDDLSITPSLCSKAKVSQPKLKFQRVKRTTHFGRFGLGTISAMLMVAP